MYRYTIRLFSRKGPQKTVNIGFSQVHDLTFPLGFAVSLEDIFRRSSSTPGVMKSLALQRVCGTGTPSGNLSNVTYRGIVLQREMQCEMQRAVLALPPILRGHFPTGSDRHRRKMRGDWPVKSRTPLEMLQSSSTLNGRWPQHAVFERASRGKCVSCVRSYTQVQKLPADHPCPDRIWSGPPG
jgi:hypothetical protein